ncbi:MLO-like protein 1 isoform X2 [Durio zibethinus]|uniref:MLO-like protein n=1 Tax=Durio zibethinus TaxID=66656 RepID=A0A6P5WR91_DURZI|nr:MLO-like protein 1 isoform X2 [Durio zibethinus]
MAEGGTTLEYTPTWVVAVVCSVIVFISLAAERMLHFFGKYLKKKNQKPLFKALQKIKEELMLLGFISLLLTVFRDSIAKICISKDLADRGLPCQENKELITAHFQTLFSFFFHHGIGRRLLAEDSDTAAYCTALGKAPLLSTTALHHLHIFIFVLAVAHVTFCALTILFGSTKIHQWKSWEDHAKDMEYDPEGVGKTKITQVQEHDFIRNRFLGIGKNSELQAWVYSFCKQFYGSVTESDYITLRLGFIMTHCRGNPKFNFHNYMMRALEADFKKVVGISWYLWAFVTIFLLLNFVGWHTYFWIAFIPFILLLAVGTKLEHIITQLAQEVAERHIAVEGELVVQPSDNHFWFNSPRLVLRLIHIILFQNSFEMAFFAWIWVQYGFNSCMMGQVRFIIPRLVIGVFVQFVCSYSTLPLYAFVTQMGSSYTEAIFEEHIREGLVGWARKAKKNNKGNAFKRSANGFGQVGRKEESPLVLEMAMVDEKESAVWDDRTIEIESKL